MSYSDINSKIKAALQRAASKVSKGGSSAYLLKEAVIRDPLNGDAVTVERIRLNNAIVTSYERDFIDNETIFAGDLRLVSDSDVEIMQGDIIEINAKKHTVISVDDKKPTDFSFVYISQLRAM